MPSHVDFSYWDQWKPLLVANPLVPLARHTLHAGLDWLAMPDAKERRKGAKPLNSLRLLHTSDVHLGSDYWPEQATEAFKRVVDVALARRVDLFILAGDFFDHGRVHQDVIDFGLAQLGRLQAPAVLIPGNHDLYLYQRLDLNAPSKGIHLIQEYQGRELVFEEQGVAVWGKGMEDHHPKNYPLRGVPDLPDGLWRVAVAHGHYVPAAETPDRSSPIKEQEIAALACDYVALGHWHHFFDASSGGVTAFYSGSPSEKGEIQGSVNLVTLEPGKAAQVQRIRIWD